MTNSSGLTLDGGSFSVMDEETFAGLRKEIDQLETQRAGAQEALDKMAQELSFDVKL